jgi:hypothetical protein
MTDRLLEMLREHSFRRGTFTLSSGKTSDFFIDCKPTVLRAEGHVLVGAALMDAALRLAGSLSAVAGVELGGCSLASAVAFHSFGQGRPLDAVYVRKTQKGHGTQRSAGGRRAPAARGARGGARGHGHHWRFHAACGGPDPRGRPHGGGRGLGGRPPRGWRRGHGRGPVPYVSLYSRTDFMTPEEPAR